MSIKLKTFDLYEGESIVINFGGSAEHSICIAWDKDDNPFVQGPMNTGCQIVHIYKDGMVPRTYKRFKELVDARQPTDSVDIF